MYPQQQQPSAPRPYGQSGPAPLSGLPQNLKNGWAFGTGLSMLILSGLFGLLMFFLFVVIGSWMRGDIMIILGLVFTVMVGLGVVTGLLTMKEKYAGYIIGLVFSGLGVLGGLINMLSDASNAGSAAASVGFYGLYVWLFIMCIKRHNQLKPLREQAANNVRASRAARRPAGPRPSLNQQPIQQGYAQPQFQQPAQQGYAQPQFQQPVQQMPVPQPASVKPAMSSKQAAMQLFLLAAGLEADHLESRKARALAGVNKAFGEKSGASFTGMLQQLQVNPTGATKISEYIKPIVNASNDRLPPSIVRVVTYILKDSSVITPVGADFIKRLEEAIAEGPQEDTVVLHDSAFQQQLQQPPQY